MSWADQVKGLVKYQIDFRLRRDRKATEVIVGEMATELGVPKSCLKRWHYEKSYTDAVYNLICVQCRKGPIAMMRDSLKPYPNGLCTKCQKNINSKKKEE